MPQQSIHGFRIAHKVEAVVYQRAAATNVFCDCDGSKRLAVHGLELVVACEKGWLFAFKNEELEGLVPFRAENCVSDVGRVVWARVGQ